MKKSLFLLALAGATLASCVSDDMMDPAQHEMQKDVKIKFDRPVMYNNAVTRANVYGEIGANQTVRNYPTEEEFRIFAVKYDDNTPFTAWNPGAEGSNVEECAFNDHVVKYAGISIDGWAPLIREDDPQTPDIDETEYFYWPEGKKLAFAAVSPADLECKGTNGSVIIPTYTDAGLQIENFQISSDASKQYDLLFSERIIDQTAASMNHGANDYSGIPIKFQHALSSIRFSLMNHTNVDVRLTSLKLYGAKYKGTFTEGIKANSGGKYERTGEDANVHPQWAPTADIVAENNAYIAFQGNISFPYNAQYVSILTDAANKELEEAGGTATNTCHQLLLMPQGLGNSESDNKVYLQVNYTVAGQANQKTVILNAQKREGETKGVADGEEVNAWEMGNRYTYRLVYDAETAQKDMIYFAPSTTDWQEGNPIIVKL